MEADKVSFDDERFRAEGSNLTPTILEAAQMAREAGRDDLLTWTAQTKLPGRSFPNGAHVAEVEVDPETGSVTVARYTVVDDFGNLINPMLAEGQVHGGVAQGIGAGADRACRLRRGRPAAHRDVHGLRHAARRRCADDPFRRRSRFRPPPTRWG